MNTSEQNQSDFSTIQPFSASSLSWGRRRRILLNKPGNNHHLKAKASATYVAAVHRGDLVRPDACQDCGRTNTRIMGHHPDYAKPLDVEWLCSACHRSRHHKPNRKNTVGAGIGDETKAHLVALADAHEIGIGELAGRILAAYFDVAEGA